MKTELKEKLDQHITLYKQCKEELKDANEAFLGLTYEELCKDEKGEVIERQKELAERKCEICASMLADLVLENRERISIK